MKLKFKHQVYQANSVQAVVDCFKGQLPDDAARRYKIDPGSLAKGHSGSTTHVDAGFKNSEIQLTPVQLLSNIQAVQARQNLPQSTKVEASKACAINLDVEMETGTGKTYCYVKTIFELNKQYGWSKFIIVVPSIAIREGVYKSLQITAEHFQEDYHKQARFFIYNSKQLHQLESFSSDGGINVMVINVQAFNARGADARRIYDELDDFQTRRPIDVIKANRPIMILDEPQKMEGAKTLESLAEFNPLFLLRYSATHKTEHNKIYRLDALDAYNQKLVKKIAVRGITTKGLAGTNAYLYLEDIEISASKPPVARLEFEIKLASGAIKREVRKVNKGYNLFENSGELAQYQGFVVSDINANTDTVSFTNGAELTAGDACGDVSESALRRMQIREAVKAHFEKERQLFPMGIKVLSLFFIDEVAKYRDYSSADEKGEYARIFEEEYQRECDAHLGLFDSSYQQYLRTIPAEKTHNGYFSIDKKGKSVDSKIKRGSESSDDISAYDLIMKNKERLLSFEEPVRFIFSHSALKEGWDNPNVFQIATLRQSSSDIKKRQEIGRGLRLAVNQKGDRQDEQSLGENEVQQVNVLTVIANESYETFARDLQSEIAVAIKNRPKLIEPKLFEGRELVVEDNKGQVTAKMVVDNMQAAEIWASLKSGKLIEKNKQTSVTYQKLSATEKLEAIQEVLDEEFQVFALPIQNLINSVYNLKDLPIENENKRTTLKLNREKYASKEFKNLWSKINRKSYYTVDFDDQEIIEKSIQLINKNLTVKTLKARITEGSMQATDTGTIFTVDGKRTTDIYSPVNTVKYDLIGEVSQKVGLLRKTVAYILSGIHPEQFAKYQSNPENFIVQISNIINAVKAQNIISHIVYNKLDEVWDEDAIFANSDIQGIMGQNVFDAKKHLYDKVRVDSEVEKRFASDLDVEQNVEMYVKLPGGFYINTPVGKYNPDWAVVLNEPDHKHVYFIAETKGVSENIELNLKGVENAKIEAARQHFKIISNSEVTYDVVDSYDKMMDKLFSHI